MSFKAVSNQTVSQICQERFILLMIPKVLLNMSLFTLFCPFIYKKKVIFLMQAENGLG